ncbi:MAG: hypothetical protein EB168_09020, partial [Euryarchaeota archaeon]|nr:hypothetical protein [Euryarchaeota archaeon]
EIKEEVSIYVKNPTVNVRLANYKITLLGEVARPGTYTVLEERIDILQAIGLAGDLTINADRRNVKLLRRTDNKVEDISLNLITVLIQAINFFMVSSISKICSSIWCILTRFPV